MKIDLNKNDNIKGRVLRFIFGVFMIAMFIYLLLNVKLIIALIFGIYPLKIGISLIFQSFGYDIFHSIKNNAL